MGWKQLIKDLKAEEKKDRALLELLKGEDGEAVKDGQDKQGNGKPKHGRVNTVRQT